MATSSKNNRPTGQKKPSRPSNVRSWRAAEQESAPKKEPKKEKSGKPNAEPPKAKKKDERKAAKRAAILRKFMLEVFPFILGALGLVLLAFLICHLIGQPQYASEHWMGPAGYYICYVLLGLLGWAAYLLPVAMLYFAICWKRYYLRQMLAIKAILAFLILITVSSIVHVFVCAADEVIAACINPIDLFGYGTEAQSGGILGGIFGFLMYKLLRLPGTIIVVMLLLLPLLLMLFIGVTPAYLWKKIKPYVMNLIKNIGKKNGKKKKTGGAAQPKSRPAENAYDDGDEPVATTSRRYVAVDADTGEVVEEEEAPIQVPVRNRRGAEPKPAPVAPVVQPAPAVAEPQYEQDEEFHSLEEAEVANAPDDDVVTPIERPSRLGRASRPAATPVADDVQEPDDLTDEDWRDAPATMEVSFDDDASEYENNERFSVHINPQETAALTGNQVDGLPDEEVVIPSGTHVDTEEMPEKQEYNFPSFDLLTPGSARYETDPDEIERNTRTLRETLESFHIRVREISCSCGPTITRFEVKPDAGVRVRSIANLVDDIALGLARSGVRIEAPIPGKPAVGIEVPNEHPATVYLRNLIEAPEFQSHKSKIAACLGADVSGRPVIFDINKMPHMLICGTTGSGKSVCINCIIMSILYKAKPEEVKMILIDPKKVEFTMYRDIPHLYAPIVSDPKKAAGVLNSAVNEMERRFELIEEVGVRNLAGYNEVTAGDPERPPLPQLVIIIDELADLMMTASEAVETAICRLAQKARAAGIHLIIGTQRPSVDVITGLMKANIPSRIAFAVSSQMDSRVILDAVGAEKLIGRGDMLYVPIGATKPLRVQGAFVSDSEVERVVSYVKDHNAKAVYDEEFARQVEMETAKCMSGSGGGRDGGGDFDGLGGSEDNEDPKLWDAIELAVDSGKISTSLMQRRLEVGYGRAAKLIDRMEELGFVGPADGNKPRKILVDKQAVMEMKMNGGLRAQEPTEE